MAHIDPEKVWKAVASNEEMRHLVLPGLVGNLVMSWANVESLFCYALGLLLKSDPYRAEAIFYTLNTTQARMNLIHRLALIFIKDPDTQKQFSALLVRFKRLTSTRNTYAHCIYPADTNVKHLSSIRFPGSFDGTGQVQFLELDKARIHELRQAVKAGNKLNEDLRAFLKTLPAHVQDSPKEPVHTHIAPC